MKKNSFIVLIFAQLLSGFAVGQTRATIAGAVNDSAKKPLSFVTCGLYRQNDLALPLKVTYTNDKGKFSFINLDTGNYTIVFTHTGFAETKKMITAGAENTSLDDIRLSASVSQLKGVDITVKKPLVEQTDDKIIFNVENDPAAKTETAIDILRKTPFVTVDGDNNVLVNGQSNFKVLLNGRETSMFANNVKEALKGFPGALITKIEIITSPSAKYDGEGIGGIINIITKKKVAGYNGSLNSYYSNTWRNLNGNLSAKHGRFGATMYFGAGGSHNIKGKSSTETIPFTPTIFTDRLLKGDQLSSNLWDFGNAELSYEIDSLNSVSSYGNINGGWNKSTLNQTSTTLFSATAPSVSFYDLASSNKYPTTSIGTDYIRKFKSNKDKEFSVRLNGEFGISNIFLNSSQYNPPGLGDRFIINNSRAKNRQYTIQSDYTLPLSAGQKLETGVKAVLRRAFSDFSSEVKFNPLDDYKINTGNTNHFKYDQDIYSVYSTYSFKINKTSFRLGARIEHTEVNGDFASSAVKVKQSYTTLLPNIQATLKPGKKFTWVLNYNMRLQRPSIYSLNPFVNNNDSLNIFYGNPGIHAQTIHSISLQSRIMAGSTFAGITLTGSYSDNMIVRFATFDPATGITRTTSGNFGKEFRAGLAGNVSTKFNENWSLSVNGYMVYNHVINKSSESQSNSGISGNANMNTSYKINKRLVASSYAGFWRSPVSIQSRQSIQLWYGTGLGYKMFHEKLTINLSAANFLQKTRDYITRITDPLFETKTVNTNPFRGMAVGLSWNFGKLKENVSKKKGVSNDDAIGQSN